MKTASRSRRANFAEQKSLQHPHQQQTQNQRSFNPVEEQQQISHEADFIGSSHEQDFLDATGFHPNQLSGFAPVRQRSSSVHRDSSQTRSLERNGRERSASFVGAVRPRTTEKRRSRTASTSLAEEAEEILLLASSGTNSKAQFPKHLNVQRAIPYLPRGGEVYLCAANPNIKDGFRWKEILHKPEVRVKNGSFMDYSLSYVASPQVSSRFQREIYQLSGLMLIYYHGDESFGRAFTDPTLSPEPAPKFASNIKDPHSHALSTNAHIPTSSSSKRISTPPPPSAPSLTKIPSQHHLDQSMDRFNESISYLQNESLKDPQETHPQFLPVVQSRALQGSSQWFSSSSSYQELAKLAEELANGKVVKNLTIFPSLQMTLIHPDMTKEFEHCCKLLGSDPNDVTDESNNGIRLFYDTTFSFGNIYGTILTFVNCCYEGDPVMPLAINLHERKFKSSHQIFWARIVGDLPALQKYRFPLIVDDAEPAVHLAIKTQAPNLIQLESWMHRFADIDRHLRGKGYGTEAIEYFKNCIIYLLNSESKQAMHDRFRKEFESVWPRDFVFYYRERLLPRSGRLGKWSMLKVKIRSEMYRNPHTNPQVEFHMNCQNFAGWDRLSVDQLVRAFYFLFLYYVSESCDGKLAGDGVFKMKRQYKRSSSSPSQKKLLRASHKYIPHPSEICDFILRNYPTKQKQHCPSSPTQRWLASYGATEFYARLGQDNSSPARTTDRYNSHLDQPKMENACDIHFTLEDLMRRNNIDDVDLAHLGPLSSLPLDSLEDYVISRQQKSNPYYSSSTLPLPHSKGQKNRLHQPFSTSSSVAPPSPAPSGLPAFPQATRPDQPELLADKIHSNLGQKDHTFLLRTSYPASTIGSTTSTTLSTVAADHLIHSQMQNASHQAPVMTTGKQTNFAAGLTTIPESHENSNSNSRPLSTIDWKYENEIHPDFYVNSQINPNFLDEGAVGGMEFDRAMNRYSDVALPHRNDQDLLSHQINANPQYHQSAEYLARRESKEPYREELRSNHSSLEKDNINVQNIVSSTTTRSTTATTPATMTTGNATTRANTAVSLRPPQSSGEKHMLKKEASGESNASGGSLTPSLMLWRKVQHYVVFGGSFITAARERENSSLKHD